MANLTFSLSHESIELYKILKFLRLAESGADAKEIIRSGLVSVNGAVELALRKQIKKGDRIKFEETEIDVVEKKE